MQIGLDHLVLGAYDLRQGIDHVEACLGLSCQPGGAHPVMGTHNALLRLGADTYLEVIAIDPDAAAPSAPRWFGLDEGALQAALRQRPRLLTWVARCSDLDAALARCRHDAGRPRAMQRGGLHWRIAVPADGRLVERGLVPPLIEWGAGISPPALRLPDDGARLAALEGFHPEPQRVVAELEPLGLDRLLPVEPVTDAAGAAGLRALIETPAGQRTLA